MEDKTFYIPTWRQGIKITDMNPGDIIYIQKTEGEFYRNYKCRFISFNKGIVAAVIIEKGQQYSSKHSIGENITARIQKCYLLGKDDTETYSFCHWFGRETKIKITELEEK